MGKWLNLSVPVGTLFGIQVRIHWSFLLLTLFSLQGLDAILLYAILFLTVLIHEFGHCFAARALGGEAHQIVLWPLGGLAYVTGADNAPWKTIYVAMAGPITHIPIAAFCAGMLHYLGSPIGWYDLNPLGDFVAPETSVLAIYLYVIFKMQLFLFCFNVFLPAYPLDGGRVVVGLMSLRFSLRTTVTVAGVLTLITAGGLYAVQSQFLAIWLAVDAASLLVASGAPDLKFHPIARMFSTPRPVAVPTRPALQLRPCPQCGQGVHPRSEICVYCDARLS